MITREQAGHIAALVQTIRTGWDTRAIIAVLGEVARYDVADVVHAAIRCAEDQTMRTPTAIGFLDADHWRPTIRAVETPAEAEARKQAQLDEAEERQRRRESETDDERAARAARGKQAALDALARARAQRQPQPEETA